MNELMIVLKSGDYLYYKTDFASAKDALTSFRYTVEAAGINTDNLSISSAYLRNFGDYFGHIHSKLYM